MPEEDIKQTKEWRVENLKGAIVLAGQTIKSLEIINGGGAIGILTFYGHSPAGVNKNGLMFALTFFGLGVASAVACSLVAYLSQRAAALNDSRELNCFRVAVALGAISVVCFIIGLVAGASALGI